MPSNADNPQHPESKWLDQVAKESLLGPSPKDAEAIESLLRAWPREIGQLAVKEGLHVALMLGMLDAGVDVDGVIDALVMHGDIPGFGRDVLARPTRVRLIDHAGQWQVDEAS